MHTRIVLFGIAVTLIGCQQQSLEQASFPEPTTMPEAADETSVALEQSMTYDQQAVLADVTGGDATGTVQTVYDRGYHLSGEFMLPEPEVGYFYEGWLVRTFPLSVISTGALEHEGGLSYTNVYTSAEDLSKYNQYVLTLEPDDGDPAPADHVLEGDFEQL